MYWAEKIIITSFQSLKVLDIFEGASMRVAFFGKQSCFDSADIGGTNSLVRRLSEEIVRKYGYSSDSIFYGAESKVITHTKDIRSCYYRTISEALISLKNYDHIILICLPLRDIPVFRNFCVQNSKKIVFHRISSVWPESYLKRELMFFFHNLIPLNGTTFGLSERLTKTLSDRGLQCAHLWPPVPESYFKTLKETKEENIYNSVRVTFVGRLDAGKGIFETIRLFENLAQYSGIELKLYGLYFNSDPKATQIHKQLSEQNLFPYYPIEFHNYTPEADVMVRDALFNTDIFVQPYRQLSSTMDTPLLILEAMAALNAVITRPYGNIPDIYGPSPCLIDGPQFVEKATNLILQSRHWLGAERDRLYTQNQQLKFDTGSVTDQFVMTLNRNQ